MRGYIPHSGMFENDVKEYGFQTTDYAEIPLDKFENDVKEYGFQT